MGRKLYVLLLLLLCLCGVSYAQTGEIRGRVTEKGGAEGVPFASVAAMLNGVQVQANMTDFDGNYAHHQAVEPCEVRCQGDLCRLHGQRNARRSRHDR